MRWAPDRSPAAAVVVAGLLLLGVTGARAQEDTPDFPRLAGTLIERIDPGAGERLLLVGRSGRFDPLVPLLRRRAEEAGAVFAGALNVEDGALATGGARGPLAGAVRGLGRAALADLFADRVDVAVMLPGASVEDTAYVAMQDVLRRSRARTVHFHWAGAFDLEGRELPVTPEIDGAYERAVLETDYRALARDQRAFVEAMRGKEIRVSTPAETDLRFRIGDRPVTRQDGDASAARADRARNLVDREVEIPAGAVRVAPLEETVNGVIVFPASWWGGVRVADLRLEIEAGRVVALEAAEGEAAVRAEMARAGPVARRFREFALGFNPLLAVPEREPWIPYYGYGAGVVRLSLGDNTELGGAVGGGWVRWNFVTDATVRAGAELWVEEGRRVR